MSEGPTTKAKSKRRKKSAVGDQMPYRSVEQTEMQKSRLIDLEAVDENMVQNAFPGDDEMSQTFRDEMKLFLAALRPALGSKAANGRRSVTFYPEDETLKDFYISRRHLLRNRQLRNNDSLSRTVCAIIEDYANILDHLRTHRLIWADRK